MLPFPADRRVPRPKSLSASRPATTGTGRHQAPPDASAAAARRVTIAQLRRAVAAGHSRYDPLAGAGGSPGPLLLQHGLSAGRNDQSGVFVAERDFLLWLFACAGERLEPSAAPQK